MATYTKEDAERDRKIALQAIRGGIAACIVLGVVLILMALA